MATILTAHLAWGANEASQTFTLDGDLYQTGTTTSLLDTNAKLTVQIINPSGNCLLYEEEQYVDTNASKGHFTIYVGSTTGTAKRTVNDPGQTMSRIFQNIVPIPANHVPGQNCIGSSYSPAAGAVRYFRVIVTPSATNLPDTLTPDIVINSVPSALIADSVQGVERAHILQVKNSGSTVLTQANLEALFTTPGYTNLQSILAGNFIKTDTSGASLPSYATDPAGAAIGDVWFDSATGQIKYQNSGGVQTVGAAGSGSITSLTMGSSFSINGTVAGTISNGSGTIDLTNTGVNAGTYTKMTVDAKGRVTAGTISLVEGDIPNLTSAGKVSGNTITSGTISGSTGVNTTGNLITTGTVSGLTVQATNLRVYNGANYIQLAAPALGGNVNLTLPTTDGNANEFLKTDGAGVLSWATATVTSTDITTALGYTPLNAAAIFAGDVSGTYNTTSVDKIKGKAVTAATVSGQMMIYDGTAWGNSVMSGDATLAHDGLLTLNKVPVSKGGTNAVTFGNNKIISSNGTGSTLQDFSCSLNQVISFDASGYAVCANVSSLSGAILNGGNTTGSDISIGTNDNKALQFKTNNTVAMTISQGGNVGIGTAAPTLALHIVKDTTSGSTGDGILIETVTSSNIWYGPTVIGRNKRASGTTDDTGILLGLSGYSAAAGNGTGEAAKINLLSDGVPGFLNFPGRINFSTTPTGGNTPETRMTIRQDGNIGIGGITAPTTALHMSGAFTAQAMSSAPSVSAVNTGRIYYDYSANKFKVSQNGAAYTDLLSSGGITSLGGQSGATQTLAISVDNSVALPTITSATNAHTWKIPMASNAGTTAGLLNKTDYDLFAAKLGTTTSFAGDVSGAYNATVVQKIQGKDITAASVSGQIMIYNGTAWTNNVMSGDATLAHDGMFVLNKVPVAKGGTNATTFGNNRIIASNGTGTALQDFTCSLNQVISFDASGNAACANASSLFAGILNGGNTTGADISLGTNDNKALSFKVNNATAVTISQSGYVGIGTATPTSPLTVSGASIAVGDGEFSFNKAYPYQMAVGISNTTANYGNIVNIGTANNVGYANSMAIGRGNVTGGADTSIAIGIGNGAGRDNSVLVGYNNSIAGNGYYSMLFGRNNSSAGSNGIAIGNGNTINADGASAFGMNISNSISDSVQIGPNNAAKMTLLSTGNVGIGTTSPQSKLHIVGDGNSLLMEPATGTNGVATYMLNTGNGSLFGIESSSGGALILGSSPYASIFGNQSARSFQIGTNNAVRMTITSAGEVGIGISNPTGFFEVQSGTSTTGHGKNISLVAQSGLASGNTNGGHIYLTPGAANGTGVPGAVVVNQVGINLAGGTGGGGGNPAAGFNGFYSSGLNRLDFATNGTNRFSVLANGNVVMGSEPTKIIGNNYWDYGSNSNGFGMDTSGTYLKTAGTTRLTVDNTGKIGIGGAAASEKLEVVGNIKTSGCLYYASSSLGTCASDEKIKEGVRPFELGLDALLGIQPVHFKYNGLAGFQKDGKEQLGVIAQQVETVAPQLVKKQMVTLHPNDAKKTEISVVDYGAFTYLIINSIKELYHQWFQDSQTLHRDVASVQSQITQKDQKIQELEQENKNIKLYLCQKDPKAPFCASPK